ncbi:MAG: acyl-CoA/acyl-ACP dehydrogenase [Chloroflexi bacterium]|nr:acyl-CoA/acyl-ACP dehydrogenase [Chloroflexota bacterium]
MNLTFSEEQEMLRKMARDFLTDKMPKATVKQIEESPEGYSPEIWQEMAGLGWMGLVLPEKHGGSGMSFLDLAMLLEETGRACLPGPFFSTVVLGALPIMDVGSEEQQKTFLPKIASGESIFTLALTEAEGRYDASSIKLKAVAEKDVYVLNGTKVFVPDAHVADHILCVARTDDKGDPQAGITLFIIDAKSPGISHTVLKTIANDKLCEVVFNNVKVSKEDILGELNHGWSEVQRITERAAAGKCCEMVGCIQQALDMTVAYAKDRKQFGKPIGSFQIIQHYCAEMAIDVEATRLAAYQAAWLISENLPCTEQVAVAKSFACEACARVMALAHQIHGAIGYTIDHDLQYFTRRAKAAEVSYGDAEYYRGVVTSQVL